MSRSLVQRSVAADCHDVDLGAQDSCAAAQLRSIAPAVCPLQEPCHGENGAGIGILAGRSSGGVEQIHR